MSRVQYSLSALTDSTLRQSFQRVSFSTLSVGSNHGLPRRVRLQRFVSVSRNLRCKPPWITWSGQGIWQRIRMRRRKVRFPRLRWMRLGIVDRIPLCGANSFGWRRCPPNSHPVGSSSDILIADIMQLSSRLILGLSLIDLIISRPRNQSLSQIRGQFLRCSLNLKLFSYLIKRVTGHGGKGSSWIRSLADALKVAPLACDFISLVSQAMFNKN